MASVPDLCILFTFRNTLYLSTLTMSVTLLVFFMMQLMIHRYKTKILT